MTRVKVLLGTTAAMVALTVGAWAGQAAAAVPASAAAPVWAAPAAFAEGPPAGVLGVCTPSWGSLVLPICV
jgi:hypothetical protein